MKDMNKIVIFGLIISISLCGIAPTAKGDDSEIPPQLAPFESLISCMQPYMTSLLSCVEPLVDKYTYGKISEDDFIEAAEKCWDNSEQDVLSNGMNICAYLVCQKNGGGHACGTTSDALTFIMDKINTDTIGTTGRSVREIFDQALRDGFLQFAKGKLFKNSDQQNNLQNPSLLHPEAQNFELNGPPPSY